MVQPNKLSRADFDVIRLSSIQGKVIGPKNLPLDNIVVRIGERYTTPDTEGNFYFYNLREGAYELLLDLTTLPQYAVMNTPERVQQSVRVGAQTAPVDFAFEIREPEKPVRKVF